ncbi:MAG: hypothetical protein V4510_13555 [bacterium]
MLLLKMFAPLLKKRDTYYVGAILVLGLLLWRTGAAWRGAEDALAARPKVVTRVDVQTHTVTVQGPERVVERVVKGEVVERVVYKDAATTTTEAQKDYDRTTTPACAPAAPLPWRYAGIMVDPSAPAPVVGLRGGVTFFDRLDLGVAGRFIPHPEAQGEVSLRF